MSQRQGLRAKCQGSVQIDTTEDQPCGICHDLAINPDFGLMKQAILDMCDRLQEVEILCCALKTRADRAELELKRLRRSRLHSLGEMNGPGSDPQAAPATPSQLEES